MRALLVTLTTCLFVLPAQAKYSGGTGEPNDPYQIATAADLIALGETPADYDKHFILTADIDLDPNLPGRKVFDKAVIAPDTELPLGFWGTPFTGVFDGNGHTISHLTIRGEWYLGLFGQLASGAEVKNLGIVDVNINGSGESVGGLVGDSEGSVTHCHSAGAVSGNDYVGGLVGFNNGTVHQCCSTGAVTGWHNVGGLVGANDEGTVTNCYSTGTVSGDENVGGLVGINSYNTGTVTECYSTAIVSGRNVGGLVGFNWGTVIHCYSAGLVSGSAGMPPRDGGTGGLVGHNAGSILNSYSTGVVSGDYFVGGLVGNSMVCSEGFGCYLAGAAMACLWDTQTSGETTSAGGTGKTTVEMQTLNTFLQAGWDFTGETANGSEDIWWIDEDKNYPRFAWEFWASSPNPDMDATDIIRSPIMNWQGAKGAAGHDVYLGESETAVANATSASQGIYRGRQAGDVTTYSPGTLEWGKTYYWRIDEVNEADPNSPWKGTVWSFTTADFIIVGLLDDFESYTEDDGRRIWETWKDGFYVDANNPGNGTGSIVGNLGFPTTEQLITHGGKQSMPMDYNNVNEPWYSEAARTWATPQDWTIDGADTLTLYSRGQAGNRWDPLYVGIEDSSGRMTVVVHPDADAVLASQWQKWHIALGDVRAAGVDVAAVEKMVIGVGDRKNPQPGGTGRIYIDDIRLTKRMP
jgi:hypothetical protein